VAKEIGLHNLSPNPGSRRRRKRVGRGEGSGPGKTAGRGTKGYGQRTGAKRRAAFEGGQMPIHMRMRKLRGPHMKKSMPFEPFRTESQVVSLARLAERFGPGAKVGVAELRAAGLANRKGVPIKVLGGAELPHPLHVEAHAFSASARAELERVGGSWQVVEAKI
jgi:large subunit ribosomal protein L15